MLDLLAWYRCLAASQLAELSGDTSLKAQNTRKAMARLGARKVRHRGRNVYLAPGASPAHLDHELLVTEAHLALRYHISDWRQSGLRDGINPDAFFVSEAGAFFLEVENANPRSEGESSLAAKARSYAAHADAGRHRPLCANFRVLFLLPTERKARNLCQLLARSGVPNLGRFWAGWHAQIPYLPRAPLLSPGGGEHRLTTGVPPRAAPNLGAG